MRPVDCPPFAGREYSAKRITLPQTLPLIGLIQEHRANFFPGPLENFQPFADCRRGPLTKPAAAGSSCLLQTLACRIAIDLLHNRFRKSEAALINLRMSFHIANSDVKW